MLNQDSISLDHPRKTQARTTTAILSILEWSTLLLAIFMFTVTETYQPYVTAGVFLLAFSSLARIMRTRRWLPHTGLEAPAVLFIGSAALAARIAYHPSTASLQFVRILALFALFYAIAESHENWLRWLAGGFLLAAALLALYWPLQNDFATQPGKLALITEIGLQINRLTGYLPALPLPSIHSNVAAGTLALALPFGAALAWDLWKRSRRILALLAVALTLVVLAGLFLTSSRGAWLATIVTAGLALLAMLQRRFLRTPGQKLLFWGVVIALGLAGFSAIWLTGRLENLAGVVQSPNDPAFSQSRPQLWQQGIDLIRDYPFTGAGLMTYWMTHSIYRLLIHVPVIAHAHNSFLQVWIDQGIMGIIALTWTFVIVLTWQWRALSKSTVPALGWGGLAALCVVGLHGLVDVVFYVERTLPLLGLVLGFAWLAVRPATLQNQKARKLEWIIPATALALAVLVVMVNPAFKAAWYANLGTTQQTRLELAAYNPVTYDNPTLDQVRRQVNLQPAEDAFQKALAIDPTNRTSLQRMAEISLSQGKYAAGLEYASRLWEAGWRDEVTRMVYSDALVANQNPALAAEVLRGLARAEMRLHGQAWYRYWLHQDYQRAADAWMAMLLLDPQSEGAKYWMEQALAKLK